MVNIGNVNDDNISEYFTSGEFIRDDQIKGYIKQLMTNPAANIPEVKWGVLEGRDVAYGNDISIFQKIVNYISLLIHNISITFSLDYRESFNLAAQRITQAHFDLRTRGENVDLFKRLVSEIKELTEKSRNLDKEISALTKEIDGERQTLASWSDRVEGTTNALKEAEASVVLKIKRQENALIAYENAVKGKKKLDFIDKGIKNKKYQEAKSQLAAARSQVIAEFQLDVEQPINIDLVKQNLEDSKKPFQGREEELRPFTEEIQRSEDKVHGVVNSTLLQLQTAVDYLKRDLDTFKSLVTATEARIAEKEKTLSEKQAELAQNKNILAQKLKDPEAAETPAQDAEVDQPEDPVLDEPVAPAGVADVVEQGAPVLSAQAQMLADVSKHAGEEVSQIFQTLTVLFPNEEIIKSWKLEQDGKFVMEFTKPFAIWLPDTEMKGVTMLFGIKTSNKLAGHFVRGNLDQEQKELMDYSIANSEESRIVNGKKQTAKVEWVEGRNPRGVVFDPINGESGMQVFARKKIGPMTKEVHLQICHLLLIGANEPEKRNIVMTGKTGISLQPLKGGGLSKDFIEEKWSGKMELLADPQDYKDHQTARNKRVV